MMFRKRKQIIENMQGKLSDLVNRHYYLRERVTQLEQKVKQLECEHDFKFDHYYKGRFGICCVYHKCTECGKTTVKYWDNVAKKGQQALKLLNLVPKDWKIKGDK